MALMHADRYHDCLWNELKWSIKPSRRSHFCDSVKLVNVGVFFRKFFSWVVRQCQNLGSTLIASQFLQEIFFWFWNYSEGSTIGSKGCLIGFGIAVVITIVVALAIAVPLGVVSRCGPGKWKNNKTLIKLPYNILTSTSNKNFNLLFFESLFDVLLTT